LSELSNYVSKPGKNHLVATKRILRYLQFSKDYHLEFSQENPTEKLSMYGYCDASRGFQEDGSSFTGFVSKVLTAPVTWCAKKQSTIAVSTAEAEHVVVTHDVRKQFGPVIHIKVLVTWNWKPSQLTRTIKFVSKFAKNDMVQARTKHMKIRYHFSRPAVESEQVKLIYCPTELMLDDALNKVLCEVKFAKSILIPDTVLKQAHAS
jgi:hypothetical protein